MKLHVYFRRDELLRLVERGDVLLTASRTGRRELVGLRFDGRQYVWAWLTVQHIARLLFATWRRRARSLAAVA